MSRPAPVADDLLRTAATTQGELGPHPVLRECAEIPTRDGITLVSDIYHPAGRAGGPVILMRTPYGRANRLGDGIYWASHGYRIVIQDCRGSSSYFAEAADGADTAEWIAQAPWFGDALLLHGASYLGFTAWATASTRPAVLRALSVQIYSSNRVSAWYPGGTFGLDVALPWAAMQAADNRDATLVIDPGSFNHLPLGEADIALTGSPLPFYRERLRHGANDPHWAPLNFRPLLAELEIPVLLIDGWFDYHRRYIWQDYQELRRRQGADTRLVIGPWAHSGLDQHVVNAETRRWFDDHLAPASRTRPGNSSLKLYVTPSDGWVEAGDWPPRGAVSTTLYLCGDHTIAQSPPLGSAVSIFMYDPADPTPAVGLSSLGDAEVAMPTDNRALEARSDVLTYTTPPLEHAVTLVGTARAHLFVQSTRPTADFFVRITDVHPDGTSINVVDGITRVEGQRELQGDAPLPVDVDLGPVAHYLLQGHAIRVQISSGAHPVFARNHGGTEPLATAIRLYSAEQRIYLGDAHASRISVNVLHGELNQPSATKPGTSA